MPVFLETDPACPFTAADFAAHGAYDRAPARIRKWTDEIIDGAPPELQWSVIRDQIAQGLMDCRAERSPPYERPTRYYVLAWSMGRERGYLTVTQ